MFRLLVVVALVLTATVPAAADRHQDCSGSRDLDRTIRGCTRIIKRGKHESRKNRALAYAKRGYAYHKKGQTGRAIADYTKAIQLSPRYVKAYYNRGNAYRDKRQRDRAIAG